MDIEKVLWLVAQVILIVVDLPANQKIENHETNKRAE